MWMLEETMLFRFRPITNNMGMSILLDMKTGKCYQPNGEPVICDLCKRTTTLINGIISCTYNCGKRGLVN